MSAVASRFGCLRKNTFANRTAQRSCAAIYTVTAMSCIGPDSRPRARYVTRHAHARLDVTSPAVTRVHMWTHCVTRPDLRATLLPPPTDEGSRAASAAATASAAKACKASSAAPAAAVQASAPPAPLHTPLSPPC